MPLKQKEGNSLPPLTPREITRRLEDMGYSQAGWAREKGRTPWAVRAVIHRHPEVIYQEIREQLAATLGEPVYRIGREPKRISAEEIGEVVA